MRTQKIVNGLVHDYYYVDGKLMYEKIGNEYELYFQYDCKNNLQTIAKNNINASLVEWFYVVTNAQKDVIALYSENGCLVAKYTYDAWGKTVAINDNNGSIITSQDNIGTINPIRYRGYYCDDETGLYYLQTRYYNPEIGRFFNSDDPDYLGKTETVLSYNAFSYCENNPIINTDDDGHFSLSDLLRIFSKVVSTTKSFDTLVDTSLTIKKEDRLYNNKKIKNKYILTIKFNSDKAEKSWTEVWQSKNCRDMVDTITQIILGKFKEKAKRDFLFSNDCVSEEIYLHLYGYMWSIGKATFCPIKFSAYYVLNKNNIGKNKKDFVKGATQEADIYEVDMFFNKSEAAWYGFDYYNGIASCYKKTEKDPYYNSDTRERSSKYTREGWLYETI